MTKTFLKVTYITFLWLILLANLLFVFDLTYIVLPTYVNVAAFDPSDNYFGISTLITAFKKLDEMPIGKVASLIGDFYTKLQSVANNLFHSEWPDFNELETFWDAVLAVFGAVAKLGKVLVSIWVYGFSILIFVIYMLMLLLTMFFTLVQLIGGYYYSTAPTHIWDEDIILCIGNVITPLISAV